MTIERENEIRFAIEELRTLLAEICDSGGWVARFFWGTVPARIYVRIKKLEKELKEGKCENEIRFAIEEGRKLYDRFVPYQTWESEPILKAILDRIAELEKELKEGK